MATSDLVGFIAAITLPALLTIAALLPSGSRPDRVEMRYRQFCRDIDREVARRRATKKGERS